MSEPREKDHWAELADLLGVPPDETKRDPAPPRAAQQPAVHRVESEPEPAEADFPEAAPVAEDSFEPVGSREVEESETFFEEEQVFEPGEPELGEPEPTAREEAPQDRPRRGRRRGRRGQRGDGPDRDDRPSRERAPAREESRGPLAEPVGEDQPAEEEPRETLEAEGADRNRGGRGLGRKPTEARGRDAEEDEVLEIEDNERPEPVPEEEDNEEIDELKDLNLPSWTDLIGSLYRPER
jgi:hypothetical protein